MRISEITDLADLTEAENRQLCRCASVPLRRSWPVRPRRLAQLDV